MKDSLKNIDHNLFLRSPDTELTEFCSEALSLGEKYPEILRAIERDQDTKGKLKKRLREADRRYALGKNTDLPALEAKFAEFIKKDQRAPVIGYKPQLAQSGNGFVIALILEAGNSTDSANLSPLAEAWIENTGVVPEFIRADDGYSPKKGRDECLATGVDDACLSDSKGKKITPEELRESEEYASGREKRSAVESLMFTLKYVFEFGQLRRRGLKNARAEMTEEIIACNFRRKIQLLEREKESLAKEAVGLKTAVLIRK